MRTLTGMLIDRLKQLHPGRTEGREEGRRLAPARATSLGGRHDAHFSEEGAAAEWDRSADHLQQRFLAMVSHEFRTPLAIIDAAAQNIGLRDQGNGPGVERIRTAVQRLTRMIDGCLVEERMAFGTERLQPETFDLRVLMDEAVAGARISARSRRIDLQVPPCETAVHADRRLLRVAIDNLLENAVLYSPDGSTVTVIAGLARDGTEVVVEDQGNGVREEDRARIFEKYRRSDNTTGIPGAGLGLYLVRGILEAHGGSVECAQGAHGGCRFSMWIPQAPGPSGEAR